MHAEPELLARAACSRAEVTARRVTGRGARPEIVFAIVVDRLARLLGRITGAREVTIRSPRHQLRSPDRKSSGPADENLAAGVPRGPDDRARGDFGLEDRRNRLRLARH